MIAILVAYHILFYWKAYFRPFDLARSELLSTFFPSWVYLGKGDLKHDPYYWCNYSAHPVLSSYYPIHSISAFIGQKLRLDHRFALLCAVASAHVLFGSIGWFILIKTWSNNYISLFGAITLTYSAYNIKQQPCTNYTIGWFPWLLIGIASNTLWLSSLSFGMVLLAGYYPVGIQISVLAVISCLWLKTSLLWVLFGTIIGLPQLIPFLKHLPKTIRANAHDDIGRVPWWQIPIELISPFRMHLNGVSYQEMSYYIGLTPLLLIIMWPSVMLIPSIIFIALMMGLLSHLFPRIPARWTFSFQLTLGLSGVLALQSMSIPTYMICVLCVLQMADLYLNNSSLLVTSPYSELPKKPSRAFNTPLTRFISGRNIQTRVSGLPYPLFTGHINKIKGLGYCGGMQTKEMAALRGDTNPNGSGFHDWFRLKEDGKDLDDYGIRYAYTRTRPSGWTSTPVRFLWENPRL